MTSPLDPRPTPLRILFAGTPEFAAESLAALIDSPHEVVTVYTQPDRLAGRGRKLSASPVKQLALKQAIPVCQPANFKAADEIETLRNWQADLMVVAAYGLLLPAAVLHTPRLGCINIHASLLPRWRGAAPVQRAILAGDTETGITIMQMDEGLDTGDILLKVSCPITDEDTGGSLHDRLARLGATALLNALEGILDQTLTPKPQDDRLATYANKLDKNEALIDWQQPAIQLMRQVRAFNPWPVSFTYIESQPLRIWQAQALAEATDAVAGTIIAANKQGIDVACGEGRLRLLEIQPAAGRPMDVAAFLNGHEKLLHPGVILTKNKA